MKNYTIALIALLSTVLTFSEATAQQETGKGIPAVPAIAEGLSLHNLFQSNMVLQRELGEVHRIKFPLTYDSESIETLVFHVTNHSSDCGGKYRAHGIRTISLRRGER